MFDIKAQMKKYSINQKYVAEISNRGKAEISKIVNSSDDEVKLSLWEDIIKIENDKRLYKELSDFYREFFSNNAEMEKFIVEKLGYRKSNIPRRMINNIQRLVTLSDDIEKIKNGRDCLRLFFLVVCIETLYKFANSTQKKLRMVIDFFQTYVAEDDKIFLLSNIRRDYDDCRYKPGEPFDDNIDLEIFARIMYEVRSYFVHEGDYSSFHFAHNDIPELNHISVKEKDGAQKEEMMYSVSLKYADFRKICVNGLINYANQHFLKITQ